MKKTPMRRRIICFILTLAMLLSMVGVSAFAASGEVTKRDESTYNPSTLAEMKDLADSKSYSEYLEELNTKKQQHLLETPENEISVDILQFTGPDEDSASSDRVPIVVEEGAGPGNIISESQASYPESWENFGEENYGNCVYLPSTGSATWSVMITPEMEGFYYIKIEYYSVQTDESRISSIERKLLIDGTVPFKEVSSITFDKDWLYSEKISEVVTDTDAADTYYISYETKDDGYYKIVTSVEAGKQTVTTYMISQDINGNSMAPEAEAISTWNTSYISDPSGNNEYVIKDAYGNLIDSYADDRFEFFFNGAKEENGKGVAHTITLEATREPMIIKSITLVPASVTERVKTYDQVLEEYKALGYTVADGDIIRLEAEFPDIVSDSSVAASNDNTSAINYPISASSQMYNVIGETGYSSVGQWAAYKFKVTKSGLYNISMRYKQDTLQGMFICRSIKLSGGHYGEADGTPSVPFAEADRAEFNYSKDWESQFVSFRNDDGGYTPMMLYFEENVEYTLYLECSLGNLKEYIQKVESTLDSVNACYLEILKRTGSDPDENLDYSFQHTMRDKLITLCQEALNLMEVKNDLEALCGTNGSHIATLETIATLLAKMGNDNGEEIAANMSTFKSYLGTLGTWINSSKSATMMVDSISIIPATTDGDQIVADSDKLPEATAGFFKTVWFEIKAFFSSFFVDYDQMGLTEEPDENSRSIDVWLATGRDQSQIWRTMIDAQGSYTSSTGVAVSLKLVTAGTLLPSILSRKGPDVYMGLAASDVINYAIRDAVLGISGNLESMGEDNKVFSEEHVTYKDENGNINQDGNGEVTFVSQTYEDAVDGTFAEAAMDTVRLLDVTYGIPQTMTFAMMFYRMDVLADLEIGIPETWHELLSILPVLQTNNMSIGLSYIDAIDFMIYQSGGSMWKYTDTSLYDSMYAGARIDLDSKIALETFDFTCRLYSDYSFPVSYDASNRFRTGEMPIIIGGYSGLYNTLKVYATEIEGLWEFCSLPGTVRTEQLADGTTREYINYDSLAGITASVILYGCEGEDLLAAWQFLQWQTGKEAQSEYGNRMVALIGPSAKYETANLEAIELLSWTAKEKEAIMDQMAHMSSIVNYPGSYIISRYMQFAFLDSVNDGTDPIDSITGYIDAINVEIKRKRLEFNLWVPESAEDEPPQLVTDAE